MGLPDVAISGYTLSDIFFNYDNVNLRDAQTAAEDGLTDEQYREALALDAKEFCDMIGGQVEPEALVNDFMARI